jgi:hypothetical protein
MQVLKPDCHPDWGCARETRGKAFFVCYRAAYCPAESMDQLSISVHAILATDVERGHTTVKSRRLLHKVVPVVFSLSLVWRSHSMAVP